MLTKEDIQQALPATLKTMATDSLVTMINNVSTDPIVAEEIRNNFISYVSILKDGKFKSEDYLHAVQYVTYKLMGNTNYDAYCKTFPDRYASLIAKNASKKDISAYVSAYHKGKLVNAIMEQSLTPMWIINQDAYQKAINTQVMLMTTSDSDKVRCDAANSILTHLAKPKDQVPQVLIDMRSDGLNEMNNLRDTLRELAQHQRNVIVQGVSVIEIANQKLIEKE